jgi:hypothetical protein
MNTLNTIINSMKQNINENAIDTLSSIGLSHSEAVKVVVENDFDLLSSAELHPVEQF